MITISKYTIIEGFDSNMDKIQEMLTNKGVNEDIVVYLSYGIVILMIFLTCVLTNFILKKIVIKIVSKIAKSNKYIWDDIFLEKKVIHRMFHAIPGIIVFIAAPLFDGIKYMIQRFAAAYILITLVFILNSLLDSINAIYSTRPISKVRPIKGLLQVIKIVLYIVIAIAVIATLMGENPLILLSGIGALTAVFSFVFKDSILGFIAGIQLTSNDMLRIGDWIEMSKYGADGEVIDITLNTVKIQNFDKTIVTIPAYALISDSFKNWRGMMEFGGRRIKRSIYIDVNSIRFCTPEMLEKFKKIHYLKDYIIEKEKEIKEYNSRNNVDTALLVNGRRMTNIGTFRAYIGYYLKNHTGLNQEIAQMVRQLPQGENGLPLEIYAFTTGTDWEHYEVVQADIFDHILSVAEEFDLRIFQNPTGFDVKQISFCDAKNPIE